MTPNPNWTVWIYSSYISYFKTMCQGINFPIYVPGDTRPPTVTDYCEFRAEGPYFNELTSGYWKIEIYISILLTMAIDDTDIYKIQTIAGKLLAMFDKDIPIYRHKSDNSKLGCMRLSKNSKIKQNVYNQIQAAVPVSQSGIEAQYQMELCYTEELLQG